MDIAGYVAVTPGYMADKPQDSKQKKASYWQLLHDLVTN